MRIEDQEGRPIHLMKDWARLYDTPEKRYQWKEGRSAHSLAEFILMHDGVNYLQSLASTALSEEIRLDRAVPRYEVRYEKLGRGRVHDVACFGQTPAGRKVFVGVEAKVYESFGPTVQNVYLRAKAKQLSGKPTRTPERIEYLLGMHFARPDSSVFDVRYQLLHGTAGTLAEGADISLYLVLVFKTSLYDEDSGSGNYRDYLDFITKAGGRPLPLPPDAPKAHALTIGSRELVCVHDHLVMM